MSRSTRVSIISALILAALLILPGADAVLAQEGESQEPAVQEEVQERDVVLENAKRQYEQYRDRAGDIMCRSVMTTEVESATITTTTVTYYRGEQSRVETLVEFTAEATGGLGGSLKASPAETIFLMDGEDVWLVTPQNPTKKLQGQEATLYETEADWWRRIPENAEISGEGEYGGRDCHILSIALRKGDKPAKAWLDKETLVFVGGEGPYHGRWMRWVNSDFREVEGRQIPHRTDFYVKDKATGSLIVEALEVNADLADDLFDPGQLKGEQERTMEEFYRQAQQNQE
jgi:outer membrane lipoprotein-sorting protein